MARNVAQRTASDREELVFAALGGLGEIGMNLYLYGYGPQHRRKWLVVDIGITFPSDLEPGVDVILPDIRFLEQHRTEIAGIVLTHAHEDHFGALIELWPRLGAPIYATQFTNGLLKAKLADFGRGLKLPVEVVELGSTFEVGPFSLELVTMAHSIPEPNGLVIRTPLGTVFHTGDWKLDDAPLVGPSTDEDRIRTLGDEGLLAIVCDSTNAFRQGTSPSETAVAESLAGIVKAAPRRVVLTTFSSNVARIKAVADAARMSGRRLVVAGRALHRMIAVAIETGYLPPGFNYLDQAHFDHVPAPEVLALVTGSQGEPRAALARIARDEHPQISLDQGDTVIFSSRVIPGNDKPVLRIQNALARMGCEIITDGDALVHVTGHPRREELKRMYALARPRIAIPMHGEDRHLREHARVAKSLGVKEVHTLTNGRLLRLAPGESTVIDEVPTGRIYRDGTILVPAGDDPVRQRRKLSVVGIVVVSIVVTPRGEVVADPEVVLDGVPLATGDGTPMETVVLDAVDGTIDSMPRQRRKDGGKLRDAVRRAVVSAVDQVWGKRPVVKVLLSLVDD